MRAATFLALRTERLQTLLAALQQRAWPDDVHFLIEHESLTNQPWVIRMYCGAVPPVPGSYDYVASIVPDVFNPQPKHCAEVMLGKQAVDGAQWDEVEYFGNLDELIAHLCKCIPPTPKYTSQ